jgi:hypothetical protein
MRRGNKLEGGFSQLDTSIHMTGLARSTARLGKWGVVAVLAGTAMAIVIVIFENYVLSLF